MNIARMLRQFEIDRGGHIALWSPQQVADLRGVTGDTVRGWMRDGWLAEYAVKLNGRWLIERDSLITAFRVSARVPQGHCDIAEKMALCG